MKEYKISKQFFYSKLNSHTTVEDPKSAQFETRPCTDFRILWISGDNKKIPTFPHTQKKYMIENGNIIKMLNKKK